MNDMYSWDTQTVVWQPNVIVTQTNSYPEWVAEYYASQNTVIEKPVQKPSEKLNYKLTFNWSRPELKLAKEFWLKDVELAYSVRELVFNLRFTLPQIIAVWKLDQPGSTIKLEYVDDTGVEVLVPESNFICWSASSVNSNTRICIDTTGVVLP